MSYKVTYPIVDSTLRSFLVVLLVSLVIVMISAAIAPSLEFTDMLLPGLRATGEDPFLMTISIRGVPWEGVWIENNY